MDQSAHSQKSSLSNNELVDKIQGIVFGTAIGDGIGLATEFMGKQQTVLLYGNGPIKFGTDDGNEFWRDAHRNRWHPNDFTDDTDQMLVLLQSLIEDDGNIVPANVAIRLNEWKEIGFPELNNKMPNGIGYSVGSAMSHPDFQTNPFRSSYQVWESNEKNLAANGAVMRTGIVGAPYFWNEYKVAENSMMAAKVTHADPRSVTSAVIVSALISRLLCGTEKKELSEDDKRALLNVMSQGSTDDTSHLEQFINFKKPSAKQMAPMPTTRKILLQIAKVGSLIFRQPVNPLLETHFDVPQYPQPDVNRFNTPATVRPDVISIDNLGEDPEIGGLCKEVVDCYSFLVENSEEESMNRGQELKQHCFPSSIEDLKLNESRRIGYAFKCLGAGLYTGSRKKPINMTDAEFFKTLITQLALETGDADTNCAVAGAILGCRLGKSGLPKGWVEGLKHHDYLETVSQQLCQQILKSIN